MHEGPFCTTGVSLETPLGVCFLEEAEEAENVKGRTVDYHETPSSNLNIEKRNCLKNEEMTFSYTNSKSCLTGSLFL